MAYSIVQTKTGDSGGYVTSTNLSFDSSTTTGNTILVAVAYNSDQLGTPDVTDNKGNTYTKLAGGAGAGDTSGELWCAYNVTGGASHQITIELSANWHDVAIVMREYSGLTTANPFDVKAEGTTASGTSHTSDTTASTSQANELVVGVIAINANSTYTAGGGYGNLSYQDGSDLYESVAMEDKRVTATGTQQATITSSATASGYFIVATFKEAATGTPLIDAVSGTDSGFANPDNGGDTDPFNSGENIQFTVQAGDTLASRLYYWRVRGIDPTGSNTYGAWATTRSFYVTVAASTLTDNFNDNSIDTAKWMEDDDAEILTETSGQIQIVPSGTGSESSGIYSNAYLDLTGSSVYAKLVSVDASLSYNSVVINPVWLYSYTDELMVWWEVVGNGDLIQCRDDLDEGTPYYSVAYNSTNHKYFRIREASGTTYWDFSADGSSWTNAYSKASDIDLSLVQFALFINVDTEAAGEVIVFDNVNSTDGETSGEEEAEVAPVTTTLSLPSVTATYAGVWNASVSPVSVTLTPPSVTATYIATYNASVSPVSLTLSPIEVTATYAGVWNASVSPISLALSTVDPTATYQGVWNASASPVTTSLSLPAVTATYVQAETASISPVAITASLPAVAATYVQQETASVSAVAVTLSPVAITATYQEVVNASVSPVSLTMSLPEVTATSQAGSEAEVSPVSLTLTPPEVTATYVQPETASVSPLSVSLSAVSTTASYVQAETASVSPLQLTLGVNDPIATFVNEQTASVVPLVVSLSVVSTTATYSQINTASVSPVAVTTSIPDVTATYVQVETASVSALSVSLSIPGVTATYTGGAVAGIEPIIISLNLPEITASYVEVDEAEVAPVSLSLGTPEIVGEWESVRTASVEPVGLSISLTSVTAGYDGIFTAAVSPMQLTINPTSARPLHNGLCTDSDFILVDGRPAILLFDDFYTRI
jgi:hypothetical protein